MIRIVFCYVDEDKVMTENLLKQLKVIAKREQINLYDTQINLYDTQMLPAGSVVQEEIEDRINKAQIILLLISATFLTTSPSSTGLAQAEKRHHEHGVRVIPIILRDCDWKAVEWIGKLHPLPIRRPTGDWSEATYFGIAQDIKRVAEELQVRAMMQEGKKQCERGNFNTSWDAYAKALQFYQKSQFLGEDRALLDEIYEERRIVEELQVRAMVQEGKKQREVGDFDASLNAYTTALTLYNKLLVPCEDSSLLYEIYMGKCDTFFADGQWNNAWESYEQTLGTFSGILKDEDKLYKLGQQYEHRYYKLGQRYEHRYYWDMALKAYEQAIQKNENAAPLYFAKGRLLLAKDDLPGALKAYRQAAQLKPRFAARPISLKETTDEKLPGKYVVQIIFNGNINGTGFFVAPGIILTAIPEPLSHVNEITSDTIKIRWGKDVLDARIGRKSSELILLYLNQMTEKEYPYLPLSEDILSFDSLSAYGYNSSPPLGFSASLTVVGFEEDIERVGLKHTSSDCRDDMSGVPLVNVRTGSVCGIMTQRHKEAFSTCNAISMQTVIDTFFKELSFLHTQIHKEDEASQQASSSAINIFITYAHEDAGVFAQLLQALQKAGFQNLRLHWNSPHTPKQQSGHLLRCLKRTQFFLFLISPYFLASNDLQQVYILTALEQYQRKEAEIIPILLESAEAWRDTEFGALQQLPKNAVSVSEWKDQDQAFINITEGIEEALHADPSLYLEPRYTKACRIFYSYADDDAGDFLRSEPSLKKKERVLSWHRSQIIAGSDREYEIRRHLEAAQIVLICNSQQYDDSPICQLERRYANAIRRTRKKGLEIIPLNTNLGFEKSLQDSIEECNDRLNIAFKKVNAPTPKQQVKKVLSLVLVLAVAFSLLFMGARYQASLPPSAMVTVSFDPQTQQINQQTYTFLTSQDINNGELAQNIIRLYSLSYPGISTQQANTTGQSCAVLHINCHDVVSSYDVNKLTNSAKSQLGADIKAQLQTQIENLQGTPIEMTDTSILDSMSNPQVGQDGQSVKVTVVGQRSATYVLNAEVTDIVHQLLVAQIPQGYQIIEQTFHMTGQLVINSDGSLGMEAEAEACYHFSQAQLNSISMGLAGQSVTGAESFLRREKEGVNPKGNIQIHFTSGSGNNLPNDPQHIKLSFSCPTNQPSSSQTSTR